MLMFLLVSFFISLVPTPAEATVETFLNGLTVKLENTVTENSLHGKNVRDITERQRRSGPSSYRPYTGDPYDVGPIGMCSYPQLDVCNFSDSYTVPEYVARTVLNYNDVLKKLKGEIRNLDGSRCAESMMNFMCKELIAPQCISSTTVRYPSNSLSKCQQAISSCPSFVSYFPTYCTAIAREQPTGHFSLTQCRIPSVSGCSSTRPSPDWMVAQFEHTASSVISLDDVAENANLHGSCKGNYMRLACTKPTCEKNGRLQGYRSSAQCRSVLNCLSDTVERESVEAGLQCNHMDKLRHPSSAAASGRTSLTNSDCGTSLHMGIAVSYAAFVLLIILV